MIDTDRMKAAFAATPLCQRNWTEKDKGGGATKLCAISALVSFAGVQPELIHKMASTETDGLWFHTGGGMNLSMPAWVANFALPVLRAEYGIIHDVGTQFPAIFDKQENEWRGVQEVLALCDRHNIAEMHEEAISEDYARFPQYGPAQASLPSYESITFASSGVMYFGTPIKPKKPKAALPAKQKPGQSKFWTASKTPPIAKLVHI